MVDTSATPFEESESAPARPRRPGSRRPRADAPDSLEAVRRFLLDHRRDLSPMSLRTAELVLRHPEFVAFGSMTTLARAAGVSVRTVMRLLDVLGYESFADLRAVCATHLLRQPSGPKNDSRRRQILDEVCVAASDAVAGMRDPAAHAILEHAVAGLSRASTIYLLPDPRTGFLAAFVETAAWAHGIRTVSGVSPIVDWPDVLRFAGPSDAALCLRITAVEDETERQIAYLTQRGVPTFDPLPIPMAFAFRGSPSARNVRSGFGGEALLIAAAACCESLVAAVALRRVEPNDPG